MAAPRSISPLTDKERNLFFRFLKVYLQPLSEEEINQFCSQQVGSKNYFRWAMIVNSATKVVSYEYKSAHAIYNRAALPRLRIRVFDKRDKESAPLHEKIISSFNHPINHFWGHLRTEIKAISSYTPNELYRKTGFPLELMSKLQEYIRVSTLKDSEDSETYCFRWHIICNNEFIKFFRELMLPVIARPYAPAPILDRHNKTPEDYLFEIFNYFPPGLVPICLSYLTDNLTLTPVEKEKIWEINHEKPFFSRFSQDGIKYRPIIWSTPSSDNSDTLATCSSSRLTPSLP